jgi:hypothetical protein
MNHRGQASYEFWMSNIAIKLTFVLCLKLFFLWFILLLSVSDFEVRADCLIGRYCQLLFFSFFLFFLVPLDFDLRTSASPLFLFFFSNKVCLTLYPVLASTMILLISVSWVDWIIGMSHQYPAIFLFYVIHNVFLFLSVVWLEFSPCAATWTTPPAPQSFLLELFWDRVLLSHKWCIYVSHISKMIDMCHHTQLLLVEMSVSNILPVLICNNNARSRSLLLSRQDSRREPPCPSSLFKTYIYIILLKKSMYMKIQYISNLILMLWSI